MLKHLLIGTAFLTLGRSMEAPDCEVRKLLDRASPAKP
jgi:hypothetical protein